MPISEHGRGPLEGLSSKSDPTIDRRPFCRDWFEEEEYLLCSSYRTTINYLKEIPLKILRPHKPTWSAVTEKTEFTRKKNTAMNSEYDRISKEQFSPENLENYRDLFERYKKIINNLLNYYDNKSQKERFERFVNDIERKEEEYLTEAINKLIIAKAINIASGGIPEINRIIIEKLKQTRKGKKESGGN